MASTASIKVAPRKVGVVLTAVWGRLMGRTWSLRFNIIVEHFLGLLGLGSFPTQALIQLLQPRWVAGQWAPQRATGRAQTEVAERVARSAALDCTEGRRPVQEALVLLR